MNASPKSYGIAVGLSAIFGIFGIHFFYIGRPGMGVFDLSLSLIGFYLIFTGEFASGLLVLAFDYAHTLYMTIRLLIGMEVDGFGKPILYPGQKLHRDM